jgi:hypothetical protein
VSIYEGEWAEPLSWWGCAAIAVVIYLQCMVSQWASWKAGVLTWALVPSPFPSSWKPCIIFVGWLPSSSFLSFPWAHLHVYHCRCRELALLCPHFCVCVCLRTVGEGICGGRK